MGILYDTYQQVKEKKRCTVCGCLMDDEYNGDICEVCLEDMGEVDDEE